MNILLLSMGIFMNHVYIILLFILVSWEFKHLVVKFGYIHLVYIIFIFSVRNTRDDNPNPKSVQFLDNFGVLNLNLESVILIADSDC